MTSFLLALVLAVVLVVVVTIEALGLFAVSRLLRAKHVTYRRALLTVALVQACGLPVSITDQLTQDTNRWLVPLGLGAIATLALQFFLFKRLVAVRFWKAAAMLTLSVVIGGGAAFALLLGFRRTVMEPFLIPTGAMAPTLYGKHVSVACTACKRPLDIVEDWWSVMRSRPPTSRQVECPNCGTVFVLPGSTPVLDGDRIVASRVTKPRRWDCVVFRNPFNPSEYYAKRLIGLPGDTVELSEGDVFINSIRARKEPGCAEEAWVLVHDTAFLPPTIKSTSTRMWEATDAGSPWSRDGTHWRFNGADAPEQALVFSGPIDDRLEYNSGDPRPPSACTVRDVKVECTIESLTGPGAIGFAWRFRDDEVRATIKIDQVTLTWQGSLASGRLSSALNAGRRIAFVFRDGAAYLLEDGRSVARLDVGSQDLASTGMADPRDEEAVRISILAEHSVLSLSRIATWRDVFYRWVLDPVRGQPGIGCRGNPIALGPDEYYVLGDNSASALDSRLWSSVDPSLQGRFQPGTVPRHFMAGPILARHLPVDRYMTFR